MGDFDNEIKEENGKITFNSLRFGGFMEARKENHEIMASNMKKIDRKDLLRAGMLDQRMESVNSIFDLYVMGKHGVALKDIPKFERGELPGHDKEAYLKEFEQFVKDHPVHELKGGKTVNYPEGAKAWAEVYREANKQLKQYEIPNVDLGNPDSYGEHMQELAMVSRIGTDMVQLLDQQMENFKDGDINQGFAEGFGSQKEQNEFIANLQNLQFTGGFLESCTKKFKNESETEIDNYLIASAYARDYAHKNQHLYGGKTLHEFRQNMPHVQFMNNSEGFMPNAMTKLSSKTPEEQKAFRDFMEKGTPLPKAISDTMDQDFTMLTDMIFPQLQGDDIASELNDKKVVKAMEDLGKKLQKKNKVLPSVADLSPEQRQAALRGFYDHIQPAFRMYGTMGSMDACGMDHFDMIQVNGKQLRQHCEEAYQKKPAFENKPKWENLSEKEKEQFMMMETVRASADPAYDVVAHDLVVDSKSIPSYATKKASLGKFDPQAKVDLDKAELKAETAEKKDYEKRKKKGKLTPEEKAAFLRNELGCNAWYDSTQLSSMQEAPREFGEFCHTKASNLCKLRDAPIGPQTVFQLWLMGNKGKSLDEVVDMYRPENLKDPIKRAQKDLLVDEFKRFVKDHPTEAEIGNNKTKPVPENLKAWGKVYKNAIDKIKEHKFPDISVADSKAFEKYSQEFVTYFNLGINIAQEGERMYHQGNQPGYAGPFIEGMGGSQAFQDMSNVAGVLQVMGNAAQSCYRVSPGKNPDAVTLEQVSGRLFYDTNKDVYKGKTVGEVAGNMNKAFGLIDCTIYKDLEDFESGPAKTAAKTAYLKDFIKGKVGKNALTEEIYQEADRSAKSLLNTEIGSANSRMRSGASRAIDQRYELFAKDDGTFKDVKDLTPEELEKAHDLYHCSYGSFLGSSTYNMMSQNEKKDFSDMIQINGKTARELFDDLYKDLPPMEKEKRIMAEVMKASVTPGNRIEIDTIKLENGRYVKGDLKPVDPYVSPKAAMEAEKKEVHKKEEEKVNIEQKKMTAAYVTEQQKIDAKEEAQQKKEEALELEEEEKAKNPVPEEKQEGKPEEEKTGEENPEENPEEKVDEKKGPIDLENIKDEVAAGVEGIKEGIEAGIEGVKEAVGLDQPEKKEPEKKASVRDLRGEFDLGDQKKSAEATELGSNLHLEDPDGPKAKKEEPEKADYKVLTEDHAKREADAFMAAVDKIDFNLLGKGSPEFKEMKDSIKELQDYAHGRGMRTQNEGVGFNATNYYDKLSTARGKVKKYLDHKWDEIHRKPSRKEDPSKQKREQPRIAGSVQILEKMDQELAKGEKALVDGLRANYRKSLEEDLKKEEAIRNNPKCTQADYIKSVARTADTYRALNGKDWNKRENETFEDFQKRLKNVSQSNRYANGRDEDLARHSFRDISKQAKADYKEGKRLSNEEIKAQYINSLSKDVKYVEEKDMKVYSAKEKIKEAEKTAIDYGKKLYSKKTNEILAQKAAEKSKTPVKTKDDLRREVLQAIVEQEAQKSVTAIEKSSKVDKKTKELAKAYVMQEMKKEIAEAEKKPYSTGLFELEQDVDRGVFADKFHEKVTNLLQDQNFIQMAKNDPKNCLENWTKQMDQVKAQEKEQRHKKLMEEDKVYQQFAKKYPNDYKERWDAAQDRLNRYQGAFHGESKSLEAAKMVANADEPAAFNKNDPHHEGANKELCNVLANVAVQEIVKDKIAQKDLYSMELALHPNKLVEMKQDIYEAMKKDPLFEIQAYVQGKLENLDSLKEKGMEFAQAAQQERIKKKAASKETEKKAPEKQEKKDAKKEEIKKEEVKKEEKQPRKRSNSVGGIQV